MYLKEDTPYKQILNKDELRGVIAHELAHIKNRDTLIMTITATIAGALGMLANMAMFTGGRRDQPGGAFGAIAVMILAPIAVRGVSKPNDCTCLARYYADVVILTGV